MKKKKCSIYAICKELVPSDPNAPPFMNTSLGGRKQPWLCCAGFIIWNQVGSGRDGPLKFSKGQSVLSLCGRPFWIWRLLTWAPFLDVVASRTLPGRLGEITNLAHQPSLLPVVNASDLSSADLKSGQLFLCCLKLSTWLYKRVKWTGHPGQI